LKQGKTAELWGDRIRNWLNDFAAKNRNLSSVNLGQVQDEVLSLLILGFVTTDISLAVMVPDTAFAETLRAELVMWEKLLKLEYGEMLALPPPLTEGFYLSSNEASRANILHLVNSGDFSVVCGTPESFFAAVPKPATMKKRELTLNLQLDLSYSELLERLLEMDYDDELEVTVPGEFVFSIDRRVIPEEDAISAARELEEVFRDTARSLGVRADIVVQHVIPPAVSPFDSTLVRVFSDCIWSEIGVKPVNHPLKDFIGNRSNSKITVYNIQYKTTNMYYSFFKNTKEFLEAYNSAGKTTGGLLLSRFKSFVNDFIQNKELSLNIPSSVSVTKNDQNTNKILKSNKESNKKINKTTKLTSNEKNNGRLIIPPLF